MDFPPLLLRFDPTTFEHGVLGPRGEPLRRVVSLTDGSFRDSLGVDGIWKNHESLIVADGGHHLPLDPHYSDWLGTRLMRSLAIERDQSQDARKRWLISGYAAGLFHGAYIGLRAYHGHYGLAGSIGYPNESSRNCPNSEAILHLAHELRSSH
jgi:hypothetical protein